ncbi:MAG TPA: hypothetical protein VF360_04425 [Candidatus Methanoperedens sp.]
MKKVVTKGETMVRETFEGSLWFNSSKDTMRHKLEESDQNSGVGISIGKNSHLFSYRKAYVGLLFDDDSKGQALVKKHSLNNCPHLIQECIGNWARKNGLWKLKLSQRNVPVKLKVVQDYEDFLCVKISHIDQ